MNNIASGISRRSFLKTGAALGGGVIAAGMPLSQVIWAAEGKLLKVRSMEDINKLDPGFY
ncbi:MAG: twin-arginine translocation signal domain-containing protein, partial [Mesorhizobium sp.]